MEKWSISCLKSSKAKGRVGDGAERRKREAVSSPSRPFIGSQRENRRKKIKIESYKDLDVLQRGMNLTMDIFEITKWFPIEEKYSMVDQIRRSSRSVCANISEAWSPTRRLAWKEESVFFRVSICTARS